MNALVAAASGALFALGLVVSGMSMPGRVLGFLDVLGDWDPQLAFVMGGALGTYALLYRLIRRRFARPLLAADYYVPPARPIDGRLLFGSALFGVGWGWMGLCPGPALVAAGSGAPEALSFVAAMGVGMVLVQLRRRSASRAQIPA